MQQKTDFAASLQMFCTQEMQYENICYRLCKIKIIKSKHKQAEHNITRKLNNTLKICQLQYLK